MKQAIALGWTLLVVLVVVGGSGVQGAPPFEHEFPYELLPLEKKFVDRINNELAAGKKVDARNEAGQTLLHLAVGRNFKTAAELLIGRGAELDARDAQGRTPLHWAALAGHTHVAELLLRQGADPAIGNHDAATPLKVAMDAKHPSMVQLLRRYGAPAIASAPVPEPEPEQQPPAEFKHETPYQLSPQEQARIDECLELFTEVEALRKTIAKLPEEEKAAAEQQVRDRLNGLVLEDPPLTRLHVAAAHNYKTLAERLIGLGAEVDVKTEGNVTPLHVAAAAGQTHVAEVLLEHGAKTSLKTNRGELPMSIAERRAHPSMVVLLRKHDAPGEFPAAFPKFEHEFQYVLLPDEKDQIDRLSKIMAKMPLIKLSGIPSGEAEELPGINDLLAIGPWWDELMLDGMPMLHIVVAANDKSAAEWLIRHGADLNARDAHGRTALHWAAAAGQTHTAEVLLQHGADCSIAAPVPPELLGHLWPLEKAPIWTPLQVAKNTESPYMQKLLRQYGAPLKGTEHPQTPEEKLWWAEVQKTVEQHNMDWNTPLDDAGSTAVHVAAERGFVESLQMLRFAGSDIDAQDDQGQTPAHRAVAANQKQAVRCLIDVEADFLIKDKQGRTPRDVAVSHHAFSLDEIQAIEQAEKASKRRALVADTAPLVEAIVNPTAMPATEEGQLGDEACLDRVKKGLAAGKGVDAADVHQLTALHHAAMHGFTKTAEFLIGRGANVNATNWLKQRPLHFAAKGGHREVVRLLLANGADRDARSTMGETPASVAGDEETAALIRDWQPGAAPPQETPTAGDPVPEAKPRIGAGQTYESVKAYLDGGGDINAKDHTQATALHWAARAGDTKTASLLIQQGASLEARDLVGQTPLHYAAEKGHKAMVELLLKSNANPRAAATFGYTPADAAVNGGQPAIAELIRNWGQ